MLAYRVREHSKKKRHPRNKSYEKKNKKRIKNKRITRWVGEQMTLHVDTIKYALAERSRWLLYRRRDTKSVNIPGCRKKNKKRKKRKTKNVK